MFAVLELSDFVIVAILVMLFSGGTAVVLKPRDKLQLLRLEQKVDRLIQHAGLNTDSTDALTEGVADALRAGKKIEAIRLYREATGVGLADAKAAVESAQADGRF